MIERRSGGPAPRLVENRGASSSTSWTVEGHAAIFDTWTVIGNNFFRERIARGAFRGAGARDDIRALFNHSPNRVLGRNKSKTLFVAEDSIGLYYRIKLNKQDTEHASFRQKLIRRDVNQSSFAFRVLQEEWRTHDAKGKRLPLQERTILKAKVFDVSPVTYPAYPSAGTGLAS